MERNLGKSICDGGGIRETLCESAGNDGPERRENAAAEVRGTQMEANSWDSSSLSAQGKSGKRLLTRKSDDWDSGSECQLTLVEPFDGARHSDDWDSDSAGDVGRRPSSGSNSDSLEFLRGILAGDKLDSEECLEASDEEEKKCAEERAPEDVLLVEDLEEFVGSEAGTPEEEPRGEPPGAAADGSPGDLGGAAAEELEGDDAQGGPRAPEEADGRRASAREAKAGSTHSEGTPEESATVRTTPVLERSRSADSASDPVSGSDGEPRISLEKAASSSGVRRRGGAGEPAGRSRSDCSDSSEARGNDVSLTRCEGPEASRRGKPEVEPKNPKEGISVCEGFHGPGVFFAEYECRPTIVDKDNPESSTASSGSFSNGEGAPSDSAGAPSRGSDAGAKGAEEEAAPRGGPSAGATMDVVSLPDMIGRNSIQERGDKGPARMKSPGQGKDGSGSAADPKSGGARGKESWILLDETGQYQSVTPNEVTILLNGRSADAVLQGRKEHFIANPPAADAASPRGSLTGMPTKESLQLLLMEEDKGGEKEGKRVIALERKVENTLLYIQPGMNLKASVRIIPVDTETIHLWRRTRDTGSVLSSEVDLQLFSSQDSVETGNQRHPSEHPPGSAMRMIAETSVAEQEEPGPPADRLERQPFDYSRLLLETRMMVDSLTHNFGVLQTRLDGETSRTGILQSEIDKLRLFVKNLGGKPVSEGGSRETMGDAPSSRTNVEESPSLLTVKPSEKTEADAEAAAIVVVEKAFEGGRSRQALPLECDLLADSSSSETLEGSESGTRADVAVAIASQEDRNGGDSDGNIIVNIYTVEETLEECTLTRVRDSRGLVQPDPNAPEGQVERLQEENELLRTQNSELRRKLKEISQELEKYLAVTYDSEACHEDAGELETLRDQVCNLKLEVDCLKRSFGSREEALAAENSLTRAELAKTASSLEEWSSAAAGVFREMREAKRILRETGISLDLTLEAEAVGDPKAVSSVLQRYVRETARWLLATKNENFLYERTLREDLRAGEAAGLEQALSGCTAFLEESRRAGLSGDGDGDGDGDGKIVEDYLVVMAEKASLLEEMKILKAENELLHESQREHREKLRQTVVALKDGKSEAAALESSWRAAKEERSKMAEVLRLLEEQKKAAELESSAKDSKIRGLVAELTQREEQVRGCKDRLAEAAVEARNLDKACRLKDELIRKLQKENDRLLAADALRTGQTAALKEDVRNLQAEVTRLESELATAGVLLTESQKEMTAYVTHLESVISNTQESLDKTRQKLKESNQTVSRIKSENDVFDKQHQSDLKLYNKTKDELESCKVKLLSVGGALEEAEKERERLRRELEVLAEADKRKSEALVLLRREHGQMADANAALKERAEAFSRDKDESLKEHKDLVNKYAMLSREVHRVHEKYKSVKAECNERTDLIRYLDAMLRENLAEYNGRIASLERNTTRLIEKITVCKECMNEKRGGVDAEARELRRQLEVTHRERRRLEEAADNYYSLAKHLETEVGEREKQVDELNARMVLERGKAADPAVTEKLQTLLAERETELSDCIKEMRRRETACEADRKKLELAISDLKSELNRYRLRNEVLMRSLSVSGKQSGGPDFGKRTPEDAATQTAKRELEEKEKKISELNEALRRHRAEAKAREGDLENSMRKSASLEQELRSLRESLAASGKTSESKQQERDEMAAKLLQSIKLVMEERAARQTSEAAAAEREADLQARLRQTQSEMLVKVAECQALSAELHDKRTLLQKLEDDLKKTKAEAASLKAHVSGYKKKLQRGSCRGEPGDAASRGVAAQRLDSCLKELQELRETNLRLRKVEGQCQAKIVSLQDELRDSRLLITELRGDLKTEKKSKAAFKNMMVAAKREMDRCILAELLTSAVADRIGRHLDMTEAPSRELLSGFRPSGSFRDAERADE